MNSIFTTRVNLESICLKDDPWWKMVVKLKEVHVNEDNLFSGDVDPDENLFYILDGMQIDVKSDTDYINDIPQNPKRVLEHPSGIFLLDIPVEKANKIQSDYGVFCQSIGNLDYNPLVQPHKPTELVYEEEGYSWQSIIGKFGQLPSNSVLVIDSHMFDNDIYDFRQKIFNSKSSFGIDNLFDILNSLLPHNNHDTYDIGVILANSDDKRKGWNPTCKDIALEINKLRKKLKRSYPINVEVLFFKVGENDSKIRRLIHDRRIISNYSIITAGHMLAAINLNHAGKSRAHQTIDVYPLFENIDRAPDYDSKVKRINSDLKSFKNIIHGQSNNNPQKVTIWRNGNRLSDCTQIKHRFFNS